MRVDEEFKQLLIKILGCPVFTRFQRKNMDDFLEFLRVFELKKRNITPDLNAKQTFRVPTSLEELFTDETEEDVQIAISQMTIQNKVKWIKDKMQIEASLIKQFFDKPIKETIHYIEVLLQKPQLKSVSTILMVGGFSESSMLHEAVRKKFPLKQVLIPPDAGSAVLKGAVIYGHDPRAIKERVCKYTYGIEIVAEFDETLHEEKYRKVINDIDYCCNVFNKHVQMGETVVVDEPQAEKTYCTMYEDQATVAFPVFASTQADPMYVTDRECVKLGELRVDIPDTTGGMQRKVNVQMYYSGTELVVKAEDVTSGNTVKGSFDFLG